MTDHECNRRGAWPAIGAEPLPRGWCQNYPSIEESRQLQELNRALAELDRLEPQAPSVPWSVVALSATAGAVLGIFVGLVLGGWL